MIGHSVCVVYSKLVVGRLPTPVVMADEIEVSGKVAGTRFSLLLRQRDLFGFSSSDATPMVDVVSTSTSTSSGFTGT